MVLAEKQREEIAAVAKKYNLELVLLFGSAVKGFTHVKSDLDIAVLSRGKSNVYSKLVEALSKALGVEFGRIDLSFIQGADPLFLKHISDNFQVLYGDARAVAEFRLRAFHRYEDYRSYLQQEKEAVQRFVREMSYAH
ncbi:MAG: nucleotidyltransferase domain-containing protein [Patescibacteria group bacterium]